MTVDLEEEQKTTILEISGDGLSLNDVIAVANGRLQVQLSQDSAVSAKIKSSQDYIEHIVQQQVMMYGVTTNYGGMANFMVSPDEQVQLQENLIWGHKCQLGEPLPITVIRAGMLLRAHSLARGVSGIRQEIIERILVFLNYKLTPVVREYGSIGASGDLIPLSYIAGAIIGLDASYQVHYQHSIITALNALKIASLPPITLRPKEGLALMNGTSIMTGMACVCLAKAKRQFQLSHSIHAFFIQALKGSSEPLHSFVHSHKPHKGQVDVAQKMRALLQDSQFIIQTTRDDERRYHHALIQDRYSLRCLPQYMGVIKEGLDNIAQQLITEANSANDNPLIDVDNQMSYHQGNFYGGYIAESMDNLRHYLAMLAKHIDVQIALLVTPEFSHGLSASLHGNMEGSIKHGLKGLQICGNSIVPALLFLGNRISHLYMTHAEQFNQNINSQGFASANFAIKSVDLFEKYLAIALMFAVQSIGIRSYVEYQHFDAREGLSPKLVDLYEAVYQISGKTISKHKAFIHHNHEQSMDEGLEKIIADLRNETGMIWKALGTVDD